MGEVYVNLKRKLDELGYKNILPVEAVPLVKCILADLLQTTRSLQHYMDLSKKAIIQRDSLMSEAEPYKTDNARLIQENNQLHRDKIRLQEDIVILTKENKRKVKQLMEDLSKKDSLVIKLQHDLREFSLRGICANTLSSRNKSKRKDAGDEVVNKYCVCNDQKNFNNEKLIVELTKKIKTLQYKIEALEDENTVLRSQVEHRDSEITRLNMLLEGGRPKAAINKDSIENSDYRIHDLSHQIKSLELSNEALRRENEIGLEKQHEAMLRALHLAEKNNNLQEELQKVDVLALKVEEDCNKSLNAMKDEISLLQDKIEKLTAQNIQLEKEVKISQLNSEVTSPVIQLQELLNKSIEEKESLSKEIKKLIDLNNCLKDKILCLNSVNKSYHTTFNKDNNETKECPTTIELKILLENERKMYEKYIKDVQLKLTETMTLFSNRVHKFDDPSKSTKDIDPDNNYIKELHVKLCEKEHQILRLQNEVSELKSKILFNDKSNSENCKDVINQLSLENSELTKENIALSKQLSNYRHYDTHDNRDYYRREIEKLKAELEASNKQIHILKKDKHEYIQKFKDAMELVERQKRDMAFKQKQLEDLEDENCSYKLTNRTDKASVEQLRDECHFLREQIKILQADVLKEKSLYSQFKNIQIETERGTNEIQNELLNSQKKLSLSKDTIDSLEKQCKSLQAEIHTLQNDKAILKDTIRKLDRDNDKLLIDLDNKTENENLLQKNVQSQNYEINKLRNEISELKRKLAFNLGSEHKIVDYETKISFLNNNILKLTQQLDNALMENKKLHSSLADANGTHKLTKIELENSRKEVDGLKQQLQHYVAEVRRIEELLSQKEAERSDMLEHFASLSVEANILENTNHSLESESASKSIQLQSYISKIDALETKLLDKENIIDSQSAKIAAMTCRISTLENEVKLLKEERIILEQNVLRLKEMCGNFKSEPKHAIQNIISPDSELDLYEKRINTLIDVKEALEVEKDKMKERLNTMDELLTNARREIVDLKLTLCDATSQTKLLQEQVSRLSKREEEKMIVSSSEEYQIPILREDTILRTKDEIQENVRYEQNIIKLHSSTW